MEKFLNDLIMKKAYNLYPGDHSAYQISKQNGFIAGATWQYDMLKSICLDVVQGFINQDTSLNWDLIFDTKLIDKLSNEANK